MTFRFASASLDDAEKLVSIRIEAMRESLERLGRFSPERARERFLSSFEPARTRFILVDEIKAGFVVVRPEEGGLLLDHLYILPAFQGQGIGSKVLRTIFEEADASGQAIRVGALKESDSNRFYLAHGFEMTHEGEWDNYYLRQPQGV